VGRAEEGREERADEQAAGEGAPRRGRDRARVEDFGGGLGEILTPAAATSGRSRCVRLSRANEIVTRH